MQSCHYTDNNFGVWKVGKKPTDLIPHTLSVDLLLKPVRDQKI